MTYQFHWAPTPPVETGAEKRRVAIFALGVGAVFVGSVLAQVVLSLIGSILFPGLLGKAWFQLLASTACLYACGMIPAWLILRRIAPEPIDNRRMRGLSLAAVVSVAVTFLMIGSYAGNLVNVIISAITGKPVENPVQTLADSVPLGVMALCTVLLAPIAEELFFRKVLIDRLRKYGDMPAILVSAAIFGLSHGNFSQFFYAFLLGLVFGAVYCSTGRLRYGIGLHMGINFFGSIYSTLLMRRVGDAELTPSVLLSDPVAGLMYLGDLAVYGLAILAFIPSLIYLLSRFHPRRWQSPYTSSDWLSILLLNPAVWLALLIFAGLFVL